METAQTIAITGGTGFLGLHVCRALRDSGYQVRCLTRSGQSPPDTTPVHGNLFDATALDRLLDGAAAVIHLAAATDGGNPARFRTVNVAGSERLVAAADQADCKRLILVSSDLAAAAVEPYGRSKRDAEKRVASSSLAWTTLRFPALYGPALGPKPCAVEGLAAKVRSGRVVLPGDGRQRLSFLHTEDACQAILRALEADATAGRVFSVGPPPITLDDAIAAIAQGSGLRVKTVHVPWGVVRGMVRTGLALFGALPLNITTFLTIDRDKLLDGTPFASLVGWRPRPAAAGLRAFAEGLGASDRTEEPSFRT